LTHFGLARISGADRRQLQQRSLYWTGQRSWARAGDWDADFVGKAFCQGKIFALGNVDIQQRTG
jgi:hypothetical protein